MQVCVPVGKYVWAVPNHQNPLGNGIIGNTMPAAPHLLYRMKPTIQVLNATMPTGANEAFRPHSFPTRQKPVRSTIHPQVVF
jgi:hypothetical protein